MRASRDRSRTPPAFPLVGDRTRRLATADIKGTSAKAARPQPEASPRTTASRVERSLETLRDRRRRLVGEELAAREVDCDRAAALADAVGDLRSIIARLESELNALPVGESRPLRAVFRLPSSEQAIPQVGEILIKGLTTEYFELVEITTGNFLSGPIHGFPAAFVAARARRPSGIWHQHSDERGRTLRLWSDRWS